jgi:hypothetical protein
MRSDAPGSLVDAKTLAPWLMGITGLLTMAQFLVLSKGDLVPVLGGFAIPTLATTTTAWLLARKRWGLAIGAVLVALPLAHLFAVSIYAGLAAERGDLLALAAVVTDTVTVALAFPALVAIAVEGPRNDHDAGDVLLGLGGAWFAAEQALSLIVFESAHEPSMELVFAAGIALGLVAVALSVGRAVHRRAWAARVDRGLVRGWRVREAASFHETRELAPLFGGPGATAVLERFEEHASPYRGVLLAHAVARIPSR